MLSVAEFKDYLRRHLVSSGVRTQLALSQATEIDYGQLNKIFTGKTKRPEIETLQKIAPVIKRPIAEVMAAAGYPTAKGSVTEKPVGSGAGAEVAMDERTRMMAELGEQVMRIARSYDPPPVEVPFERMVIGYTVLPVEDYVPASHGAPDATQLRDTLRVPDELLEGCGDPHVFYVAGECLKPEGIRLGNYLIVDGANTSPQNGEVVVARLDGELTMKKYYRLGDRVELRPADPTYETLTAIDGKNQLEIVGVYHVHYALPKRGRR